ncbi:MAG: type II toxin-antitoxin system PemK/MazF family toxin [Gammaproteobacteria bacterium]
MPDVQRGDVVICVLPKAYGKARPALIVQANGYLGDGPPDSVTVCPMRSYTGEVPKYRVGLNPAEYEVATGDRIEAQVMVDKVNIIPTGKIRYRVGRMPARTLDQVDRALCEFLDLPCI